MISENMIKGLFCIASQDCEGDCYKDHENFKHKYDDNWKPMVCGNCERDFVTGKEAQCCPYHQVEYGTCFEDGELWWLKELAELLKENKMAEFKEVIEKMNKICDYYYHECGEGCSSCPLYKTNLTCRLLIIRKPNESEEIIMGWEKPVDWEKVKVDTPILVRDANDCSWVKRHFAKYENGYVYAWTEGKTSWSIGRKDYSDFWKYAKLSDAEGEQNE